MCKPTGLHTGGEELIHWEGGALGLGWADMQERLVPRGLICRIL